MNDNRSSIKQWSCFAASRSNRNFPVDAWTNRINRFVELVSIELGDRIFVWKIFFFYAFERRRNSQFCVDKKKSFEDSFHGMKRAVPSLVVIPFWGDCRHSRIVVVEKFVIRCESRKETCPSKGFAASGTFASRG